MSDDRELPQEIVWDDEPRIVDFSQLRLEPEPPVEPRKPGKRKKGEARRSAGVSQVRPAVAPASPAAGAKRRETGKPRESVSEKQLANRKLALDIALGAAGAAAIGVAVYGAGLLL